MSRPWPDKTYFGGFETSVHLHRAEYECETLPQEDRLFMTVTPQSGLLYTVQCNLDCYGLLKSKWVNGGGYNGVARGKTVGPPS